MSNKTMTFERWIWKFMRIVIWFSLITIICYIFSTLLLIICSIILLAFCLRTSYMEPLTISYRVIWICSNYYGSLNYIILCLLLNIVGLYPRLLILFFCIKIHKSCGSYIFVQTFNLLTSLCNRLFRIEVTKFTQLLCIAAWCLNVIK